MKDADCPLKPSVMGKEIDDLFGNVQNITKPESDAAKLTRLLGDYADVSEKTDVIS